MRVHLIAMGGVAVVVGSLAAGGVVAPAVRAASLQDQVIIQQGGGQPPAAGQPATTALPENLSFEAASVKPNKSGSGQVSIGIQPGGRFNAVNVPLRLLIRNAYQLQDFQLVGGPGWMTSDRFDIVAKADPASLPPLPAPPGTAGPFQIMLRNLMADRFKLKVHKETREMPVYALQLARPDGKLGPQLRPATVDCAALAGRGRGGPPPAPPAPGERPACGMRIGPGVMSGGGFPLSQLATALSQFVQRVVIDRTGLTGNFDLDLAWTPDQIPQAPPGGAPAGAPPSAPLDGPSIFTALQEQLGLKLESVRGPVEVLVIDSVEQPTED